jgi:kelch-like protein 10
MCYRLTVFINMSFAFCSRFYSCSQLQSDARCYLLRQFEEVSQQSEELLELPVEELQAIVGADELNVKNEEMVWDCVLRWIGHDTDNRKGHIVDLLKNVRLGLLDRNFLHENVSIPLKCVCAEGRP